MSRVSTLYYNEDNVIEWESMQDSKTDAYINDATVSAELKDLDEVVVVSSFSLTYKTSSDGVYQGTIDKADMANLTVGQRYALEVTAASSGRDGFRRIIYIVQHHREKP